MLTAFDDEARARHHNATSLLRGWDDHCSDIPRCDIVVASRSSQVPDLAAALTKLDAHAIRRVYLTHLVGGRFVPPAVAEALGRDDEPLPDYIYAVNILRQRGIHPTIDYLEGDNRFRNCVDADDFVRKIRWSAGNSPVRRERACRAREAVASATRRCCGRDCGRSLTRARTARESDACRGVQSAGPSGTRERSRRASGRCPHLLQSGCQPAPVAATGGIRRFPGSFARRHQGRPSKADPGPRATSRLPPSTRAAQFATSPP
jgi:hypothetical protein